MPEPMGFFTDTTVCIGCKACEVACKEWNQLPAKNGGQNTLSGNSYDNTRKLDGENWRHVKFIEQFSEDRTAQGRWLMMSDVCKHCVQAGCLEVCPTGAIVRTEFDTVVIQADTCNGCRDCIAACPFGVIDINKVTNTAQKCTLCYDRMSNNLTPACAQACPTASIQFGPIERLRARAKDRVKQLHDQGKSEAYVYGDEKVLGGLNSFYLLMDKPEVYGLPADPQLPTKRLKSSGLLSAVSAGVVGLLALIGLRTRRDGEEPEDGEKAEAKGSEKAEKAEAKAEKAEAKGSEKAEKAEAKAEKAEAKADEKAEAKAEKAEAKAEKAEAKAEKAEAKAEKAEAKADEKAEAKAAEKAEAEEAKKE